MNKDQLEGKAIQLKGKLKEAFARLSDDDLALYESQKDKFMGRLQEKYGLAKEEADRRIREIEKAQRAA